MIDLNKFAKIHQYDHRKDFKEAWEIWVEENDDIVQEEVDRLNNLGYDGDILDKMFKSARYYFRKKSTEKKVPQKRRSYVGIQSALLEAMDKHIIDNKRKPKNITHASIILAPILIHSLHLPRHSIHLVVAMALGGVVQ